MGNCTVKGTVVDCSSHCTTVNCSARRTSKAADSVVRVMTESCRIREYEAPVHVKDIAGRFPGHSLFRQGDALCPLSDSELLSSSQLYLLLPSKAVAAASPAAGPAVASPSLLQPGRRNKGGVAPACDVLRNLEVLPSNAKGVWRVRLVITADQLRDILSEKVDTEALIERMRAFAVLAAIAPMPAVRKQKRLGVKDAFAASPSSSQGSRFP